MRLSKGMATNKELGVMTSFDNDNFRFAVVSFPDEKNCLGIVHNSWLHDGNLKTFWPVTKNPTKRVRMVMEGTEPTDSWPGVPCIVKGWAGTYEDALRKMQLFLYESTDESEPMKELGRGKRKRQPRLPVDYDDLAGNGTSSDSDESYEPPRPPTPPQRCRKFSRKPEVCSAMYEKVKQPSKSGTAASQSPGENVTDEASASMSLDNTDSFAVPVRRPATHAIRQLDGFQHQHDSPRESHLAGAKSPPSADTRVPVFMERILTLLNSIKITQQIHTDYFSVLMKKNEDALL